MSLIPHVDVVIDPYRPRVLQKLSLGPDVLLPCNPRLIVARLTGFRKDGKYKNMAGHDINYLAISGVLSMLGKDEQLPHPPGNILADMPAGSDVLPGYRFSIAAAERHRERTGSRGKYG